MLSEMYENICWTIEARNRRDSREKLFSNTAIITFSRMRTTDCFHVFFFFFFIIVALRKEKCQQLRVASSIRDRPLAFLARLRKFALPNPVFRHFRSRVLHDDDSGSLLGGLLAALLLVELQEVVYLGLEESLGGGAGGADRGLVGQSEGNVLSGFVAEEVVALEVSYRFHDGLQILPRRVCQVEPRLWTSVFQGV